jgi:hypothetical protein
MRWRGGRADAAPRRSMYGLLVVCVLLVVGVAASSAYASASFGIERYGLIAIEEDSSADTQAGSHPYELTAEAVLEPNVHSISADEVRDLNFQLPAGLIVDPATVPHNNAVGMVQVSEAGKIVPAAVYNLPAAPGEFARFGFTLEGVPVIAGISVRTSGGDGMTLSIENLPQSAIESVKLTLGGPETSRIVTLPTSCVGSLQTMVGGESWGGETTSLAASFSQLTGCERLPFDPSLSIAPDVIEAGTPSGYELDLNVPQNEDPEGLASADLENATVTLPEGVGISLSAADGLQACTEAQVGLGSEAAVSCPDASKIGTVAIHTPLLADPLQGAVYLATPSENPFASPLAVYISAVDPVTGVAIKLAGEIEATPFTGQLTIVLRELPQLQISSLEVHFFGGERSLLSTPPVCGLATSTSALEPWSGGSTTVPSSSFEIEAGMDGTACSAAQPFDPTFQATSTTAGATDTYGSLSLLISRTASEQQLGTIAVQAPPAVAQLLAGVPACGEPQASQGACPQASEVGAVAAHAGLGSYPADLKGEIYLTGPPPGGTQSGGASQGLEFVLPVEPGPFELGTVIIRASAQIEPGTGRLSIATGPLPSFADGAPLQFKALLLTLDRDPLRISPDGCETLTVTGIITGAQGSSTTIATEPFGAAFSPCPPQAGIPPADIAKAGGVTGGVSLAGTRITTTKGGEAAVKLRCASPLTCHGKLTLTIPRNEGKKGTRRRGESKQTDTIGTASFTIPAGRTVTVELKLGATGRALLGVDHGRLAATLTILKSVPLPSQTHNENVQLMWQKTSRTGRALFVHGAEPAPQRSR